MAGHVNIVYEKSVLIG